MTIREFRDKRQTNMTPEILYAGEFLERQGLLFGHDFITGDALDLAAAFLTRKMDEKEKEERLESTSVAQRLQTNRFQDEDWEDRYA